MIYVQNNDFLKLYTAKKDHHLHTRDYAQNTAFGEVEHVSSLQISPLTGTFV